MTADLRSQLQGLPEGPRREERDWWRRASAKYVASLQKRGGKKQLAYLSPSAAKALEFLGDNFEFRSQSDAICQAIVWFAESGRHELEAGAMTEAEKDVLSRMCAESGSTPGAVLGLAIRYMDAQLDRGVKIEV